MGKTTNRVLSMVLAVLMVISMISVFTIPAVAALPAGTEALDYDALFNDKETFLINSSWKHILASRKEGDTLYFVFRGVEHEIKYNPKKHFKSYADAYEAIWSGLNADNYFTYKPVVIFGPGAYYEAIPVHAPAIILGAQAGISPNQALSEDDWNISWLMSNSGVWPANNSRRVYEETVFTDSILFTTRTKGADGAWTAQEFSGDNAKYHVFRELGCSANGDKTLDYVVDGITSEAGEAISLSGADAGNNVAYGGASAKVAGGRNVNVYANNVIYTGANQLVGAWNSNNDFYNVVYDNLRSTGKAGNFVQRYVTHFTAINSYITGWSGSLTNASLTNAKHENTSFNIKHSVVANGPSGNVAVFTGEAKKTGFNLNLEENLIYNISGATWGAFRIDCKSAIDVVLNIKNNEIYHDLTTNTLFNGNKDYVTMGNYAINFNGNKVISSLTNIPPNAQYPADQAGSILNYNFDGNFFSTSVDEAGKPVTFVAGPSDNAPLASGWDYNDSNYFFDYDMTYSSHGTRLSDADFGENNLVEMKKNTITVRCLNKDTIITAENFIIDKNAVGSVMPEIILATDAAFENVVESIDLAELDDISNFYVRVFYKDTEYEPYDYTVQVIAADPVDFNEKFMTEGFKFAGYDLNFYNAVVYLAQTEEENGEEVAYGFLGDTYYKFKVDNEVVFNNIQNAATPMDQVKNPVVLLPSGKYGKFIAPFDAIYLGANAEINPVDGSESKKADGSDWSLGNGWGNAGETEFDSINIADGVEGELVMKGITLRGQFNDTLRTYGNGGKAYKTLDITLENVVLDQSTNASVTNPVTEAVQNEGVSGTTTGSLYAFNLINRRSINFDEVQPEAGGDESYTGFGKTYEDSFTLKNLWVKNSSVTSRFMNEFVPAHVTLDNVYHDITASGAKQAIFGWLKTGYLNKNNSFTMVNCNFRNAPELGNSHPFIGLEGASGAPSDKKISSVIAKDAKYDVVIENNIFANACRDIGTATQSYILLSPAYMTSVKINDNFALNEDKPATPFVSHVAKHDPGLKDAKAPIRGNIEISGNDFIGFAKGALVKNFGLDADEPALKDTFYTTDTVSYLIKSDAGEYDVAMGNEGYWFDFNRTKGSNDYKISSITAKTEAVSGIYLDNIALNFGATIIDGKLSDIAINLPEGAVGTWAEDIEGVLTPFEDKTVEEIGEFASYVYTVSKDDKTTTYRAMIYTKEQQYFVDLFEANGYFDNTAVIITDKAVNASTDTLITEMWYDKNGDPFNYTFTVGVNAFASLEEAVKHSDKILISKSYANKTFANGAKDITVYGPAKIFAPNFNINPVIDDGYGVASPSHGADWAFDEKFNNSKQIVVKDIVVDASVKGAVELYGFTVAGGVVDKARAEENDADITLHNTYFTGSAIEKTRSIFDFQAANLKTVDNKSSFTVKNAYFAIPKIGTTKVRLFGGNTEIAPASITFDTIYLDLANTSVQSDNSSLKNVANNSSFTIKNSLIKNSDTSVKTSLISFDGYVNDPIGAVASAGGNCDSGRSNEIVYESNIFDGFAAVGGENVSYLLDIKAPYGYSLVTVKDNYITGAKGKYVSLFRAGTIPAEVPEGYKPAYTITGNVINGAGDMKYELSNGTVSPSVVNWTIKDNFVSYFQVEDVNAEGVKVVVPTYNKDNMQDGKNLEYSHKLDARGLVSTKQIYDMTFVGGVTVSGNTITINLPDGTGVIDNGTVTLANIVKANEMNNILRVKTADGYFDAREAAPITDDLVFEVRSADGKSEVKSYNVVVNVVAKAQAFKDTFVDTTPIDGAPILKSALMVSADFAETGVVNAGWMGESYSFTMGENAFRTVGEALAYAKANSLTNVQILFKNESAAEVNFGITYPCSIYTENYNTMPYITDGYGTESESHGEGWMANPVYLDNQTIADIIWIDPDFEGKVEFNGITIRNTFIDAYRIGTNAADIVFRNTLVDATAFKADTVKNYGKVTGITSVSSHQGWNAFIFHFATTKTGSLYVSDKNSLVIENMYVANAKGSKAGRFLGEYLPYYTEFNGLYFNDMDATGFDTTVTNMRQSVAGSTFVIKNSNFTKFNSTASSAKDTWILAGTNGSTKTENTQTLILNNNIFNSFEMRTAKDGAGFLLNMYLAPFKTVKVTNNYIASPYNVKGKTDIGLFNLKDATASTKTDIEVSNNVFNSNTNVDVSKDGTRPANITLKVEDNYVSGGYVADVIDSNPVGAEMVVANTGATVGAYALNYDRTIKSNDVVYPTFAALDNLIIENEKKVTYISEDGTLPETINHIIASISPYSDVKLVVDGIVKDLDASVAGAESVAFRVLSKDETNKEDIAVVGAQSTNHVFVDYEFNNDSTCKVDGTQTAVCTGECRIEGCAAEHRVIKPDSKVDHKIDKRKGIPNNDATCQKNGTVRYTCTVCGDFVDEENPNSTVDHIYENYVDHGEATCSSFGTEIGTCKWCKVAKHEREKTKGTLNKKNHTYGEWVYNNDVTCSKNGTETHVCVDCGTSETRNSEIYTTDKAVHVLGEFKYDGNATCHTDGTMTARCTSEGCRYKKTVADPNFKANPALHVYGEYKSDNNATCCENGTQTATCSVCGGKKTIVLPNSAKGHGDGAAALTDVKDGKWYTDAIDYVVAHGYISGVSNSEFGLSVNITRGMFVTILARIAGVDTSNAANKKATTKFADVKSGKYYTAAVAWANANGVVSGKSATTFEPNANISRQELAVMIVNFAKAQKITLKETAKAVTFADASGIAKWAKNEVAACQKAGIISGYTEGGKTTFKPKNTATRAEAAQMIYKFVTAYVAK